MTTTNSQEHWCWRRGPVNPGPGVIVDIDGVLADASGRQHLRGRGDWRAFFDACDQDPLIPETSRLLDLLDASLAVLLVTGRPRRVQTKTVEWLERFDVRWDLLVTRDFGDYSGVSEFKRDVLGDIRAAGFDVRLSFEDDPGNHAMYVAEGVPCLYIHSGYYL
jgi:hypothetical protein